jgi:NAD(P)-dependent dehydrogenase (short-subunit alcohol dehydrogenase family)
MSLDGARLLVVGASAGIGRQIGLAAARSGAVVAFAARREDRLREAVEAAGGGHAIALDVTDRAAATAGVQRAVDALGGLDAVVYASGVASIAPLAEETEENWRRILDTNVVGAATVAMAALPHVDGGGVLLFLSSSNTHRRLWGLTAYGASKAALDRLVDGLRDEHPSTRCMRVTIGPTAGTEFGDAFDGATLTDAMPRWVVAGQQTARMMTVEQAGDAIAAVLALLRAFPAVSIPHLDLDPAGGVLTLPPGPEAMAQFFASLPPEG